eukprot:SAG22_NODE_21226_length_259_cov_0.606250_1_plen_54_part_01
MNPLMSTAVALGRAQRTDDDGGATVVAATMVDDASPTDTSPRGAGATRKVQVTP